MHSEPAHCPPATGPAPAGHGTAPGLTACQVCVGETLGQNDAHPGGQLARLQALQTEGVAPLVLADCLDECNRGDVVVVRPARGARRARTVWLERVAGDALTGDLRRWLRAGGPGRAAIPERLRQQIIDKRPA